MVIIVTCFKSIAITRVVLYVSNNADYTTWKCDHSNPSYDRGSEGLLIHNIYECDYFVIIFVVSNHVFKLWEKYDFLVIFSF